MSPLSLSMMVVDFSQVANTRNYSALHDALDQDLESTLNQLLGSDLNLIHKKSLVEESISHVTSKGSLDGILKASEVLSNYSTYDALLNSLHSAAAELLIAQEDFSDAAGQLTKLNFDLISSSDQVLETYIKIVRLYLEDDDSINSETYLNKSATLIHTCTNKPLILSFKLSQARILDYKRDFIRSATIFQELSYEGDLDNDDRLSSLSAAIVTAILAPAGPKRSRILSTLYRDERCRQTQHFNILEKVFLDRILSAHDIESFSKHLSSHQIAKISYASDNTDEQGLKHSPTNVLERAMIEHNLLSASKIFDNITFAGLSKLLNLSIQGAESVASHMIMQGRLEAYIDQVESVIVFTPSQTSHEGDLGGAANVAAAQEDDRQFEAAYAPHTHAWDAQIKSIASLIEATAAKIEEKGLV
ncbi:hypothetical protein E3P99_03236 [Wallemia hederae]|uniref:COP9 signalosome complex subunit 4 n=1 Tax=Wallemia hederae TaxID=1540922 RepID=A0A4T0FKT8_9BASI|nr:hypothetical protein E3P99_03236 [Wallemia hederae]